MRDLTGKFLLAAVEVHISDIAAREPWRRVSVTAPTQHQVIGRGWRGYLEAIDWLVAAGSSDE